MSLVVTKIQKQSIEIARAAFPADFGARRTLHFSFLYRGSKLLCFAENSEKTHARNRYNRKFLESGACSELNCFIKIKNKISDLNWAKMTMVNVRLGRKMEVLNSRPCKFCENLVFNFLGIRDLSFSTENGFKKYD